MSVVDFAVQVSCLEDVDLAIPEDVTDIATSAVIIAVDDDEWKPEIRTRLSDLSELRRHVAEDFPTDESPRARALTYASVWEFTGT